MQYYKRTVEYKLGSKHTNTLLQLDIANVTYVPASPRVNELRASELLLVDTATPECEAEDAFDLCYVSTSILDMCAPTSLPLPHSSSESCACIGHH